MVRGASTAGGVSRTQFGMTGALSHSGRMRRHLRQQYVDTAPRGRGHKAHRRVDELLCQQFHQLMG